MKSTFCKDYSVTACISILLGLGAIRGAVAVAQTTMTTEKPSANEAKATDDKKEIVRYESVQPILRKHCLGCHNDNEARGGLSLVSIDKIAAGSTSGHVVVPGKLDQSPLYLVTAHLENPKMPPNKPRIPQRELKLIEKWIQTGLTLEINQQDSGDSNPTAQPASSPQTDRIAQPESLMSKNGDTPKSGLVSAVPLRQREPISTFAVHRTNSKLLMPGVEQLLFVDLENKQEAMAIAYPTETITTLEFDGEQQVLYVASGVPGESGQVKRWDMANQSWLPSIGQFSDTPIAIGVSRDNQKVAVGTTSKTVVIHSVLNGRLVHTLTKHTDWVTSTSFSPDGLLLASGDRFGTIHVWEANNGKHFATLRNHVGAITSLVWSNQGDTLYSAGWDGKIGVWDLHGQREQKIWNAHQNGCLGILSVQADGTIKASSRIVSHGRDGRVCVWSADGQLFSEIKLPDEVICVKLAKDGEHSSLVVADAAGSLETIRFDPSQQLLADQGPITLPIEPALMQFAIQKPVAPIRYASVANSKSTDAKTNETTLSFSNIMEVQRSPSSVFSRDRLEADLADSQRTLQSIESSRDRAKETLSQLEESVARVKQLIAIQEARLRQLELDTNTKKETP